jgi:hypothetical protein
MAGSSGSIATHSISSSVSGALLPSDDMDAVDEGGVEGGAGSSALFVTLFVPLSLQGDDMRA